MVPTSRISFCCFLPRWKSGCLLITWRIHIDDDMGGKYMRYAYDELDQLIREEYWTVGAVKATTTIAYTYDGLGNRTSVTKNGDPTTYYGYNPEKNRLTSVGGATYTYDLGGNLRSDSTNTFAWDAANRLEQVKTSTSTITFFYDTLGRRLSKTVNGSPRYYHYEGDRVAYVTDGSGIITQIFTYDGAGRPLYLHQNGTLYQYHYNAHGDVVRLTDMNGATVATYQYDAWGNITSQSGPLGESNPYRYAGYWYDQETGLYYLKARYYKPDTGRFISQDSWGGKRNAPLTLNRYAYSLNNPIKYVDPSGQFALPAFVLMAAAWVIANITDIVELVVDAIDLVINPSAAGAAAVAADTASLALPGPQAQPDGPTSAKLKVPEPAPDFVVTPKGVAVPVPKGANGPFPTDNGKGVQFKGGSGGGNGLPGNITDVRIMDPRPAKGKAPDYPDGLAVYHKATGDPVTISGTPGTRNQYHNSLTPGWIVPE